MTKSHNTQTPGMFRSHSHLLCFVVPCLCSAAVMFWLCAKLVGWLVT